MSLIAQGHFFWLISAAQMLTSRGICINAVRVLIILSVTFGPAMLFAQEVPEKRLKLMGKFEGRNAFVRTHHASFLGVRMAVQFKCPIRAGIGYYWMQTRFDSGLFDSSQQPDAGTSATPRMRYAIVFAEYTFWEEDGWSLGVPLQIGVGEAFYRTDADANVGKGLIIPLESGVEISYQFLRWAGFGVGLGYRVVLVDDSEVQEGFNSPYYQIKVQLALTELFRRR